MSTDLKSISITFNTRNDNKDGDTILHVFVKNRRNDSSTPDRQQDFVSNFAAWQRHADLGTAEINPYLGFGESLGQGTEFDDPSSQTFDIPLRATSIPFEEIFLPVVNIHILPNGNDRWMFSYTITFVFEDGRSFTRTSDTDGVTGIILDQDNRNYSGVCAELRPLPAPSKPQTGAVLTRVTLAFSTHNDNKDFDTQLNVHIVNRLSATSNQDIAIGVNLLSGTPFQEGSLHVIVFGEGALPLSSPRVTLRDIVLPVIYVNIAPNGNDRWIFDYHVTYEFSDGHTFSSRTNGIILDHNHHKHAGVYQGDPFPSVAPPSKPALTGPAINHVAPPNDNRKSISLSYVQRKLAEFVNNRQGLGAHDPPIKRLRLHNSGTYGSTLPESYYDLKSITANPPSPGTVTGPDFQEGVTWVSSPTSIGPRSSFAGLGDVYFNDINSQTITVKIDGTSPTPLTIEIDFETGGPEEILGSTAGSMNFDKFFIRLALTLFDKANQKIDVLSWMDDIHDDLDLLDPFIHVEVTTEHGIDFGGKFQKTAREKIFKELGTKDPFDGITLRDRINAVVSSWLLGGVLEGPNGCKVQDVHIQGDDLVISYTGPQHTFAPAKPAGWPTFDFSPGNLANIDHIVVLTMENRSFDHMLGYLSLPPAKGGMGRTDVDGLKGGEVNLANGVACPSIPLPPGDTIFSPDPPHGYEPVFKAINSGKMDGFAQSYADVRGPAVAPRIMGYHTAANLPAYDALARDFAIGQRWFASHPGPTFCNRFYELTGRLNIDPDGFWEYDNSSTPRPVFTPTIFDSLSDQHVSWKYFEHGYCFLRNFEHHTFDVTNIVSFDDPVFGFVNLARSGALPSVSFIDPHFIELPPDGNCDGPPADVKEGQKLVQQVVEAVVASPQWAKTLLIIVYDEHGGFYDHVPPPTATKVSPESLGTYGVRVPAFVVSPWVRGGTVFGHDGIGIVHGGGGGGNTGAPGPFAPADLVHSLYFDHTSILKTIARRFMHEDPPYLSDRYATANDLSSVIGNELRPGPFRPFIPYNLVYVPSKMRLDVQAASVSPGAILQQFGPNTSNAQQFSFEDAGGGHFYIRTHTGSLYLTADQNLGVKQDVKYPTGSSASPASNPDTQRWQFVSNSITVLDRNKFTISNAAFPGKVLQPAGNSNNAGTAVVLGAPTGVGIHNRNIWEVTSPLLPSGEVISH